MKAQAFNPMEMLHSDAEIAEFLAEAYEAESPGFFIAALGQVVKHKGVAQLAKDTGLGRESLYKTFNGKVQPKWDTVHRLLKALGVHMTIAA